MMNPDTFPVSDAVKKLGKINKAIIICRGLYSKWAAAHQMSYNEMLILYTLRDKGFCTQKQVCQQYLLPRQTINHVMRVFTQKGYLEKSPLKSTGHEQAFVLTKEGQLYARPFFDALDKGEEKAAKILGDENISALTELMTKYDEALLSAFEETR